MRDRSSLAVCCIPKQRFQECFGSSVTYIRMSYEEESGLFSRGIPQDGRIVNFSAVNVWRRLHEAHYSRWDC